MNTNNRPKVIIIGAGFGGLYAAKTLANQALDVLLIDRNNFHTFTPLIYQVATCALDPSEVAYPVRTIFYKRRNIRFLLGEVIAIDTNARMVSVQTNGSNRSESYDYLIFAAGSAVNYFGGDDFRQHTFELRTLRDAVDLRNHILRLFERAAWVSDMGKRDAMTTLVVVGGGATGLETAGAIHELYNYVLDKEFKAAHLRARVILVEMLPHLLPPYPAQLRDSALRQLESLGVEVMLGQRVTTVAADHITLEDGTHIPTHTLIWAAGVSGSPLATMLGVSLDRSGRVPVQETCEVRGLERVYVVGDSAFLPNPQGEPYPMLIPVAQQQGVLAAKNILRHLNGQPQAAFHYHDRGIMATIGRSRAVVYLFNRLPLSGYVAWVAWLGLHLVTLIGFRNRLNVLVNWVWNYFTYDRSVRIILDRTGEEKK